MLGYIEFPVFRSRPINSERDSVQTKSAWLWRTIGVIAMILLAGALMPANAATEAELVELIQCSNTCRTGERACQSQCCGLIFCRKSCLSGCTDTVRACEGGCYSQLGGAPASAFDETMNLNPRAYAVHASGPLRCPEGAQADISVTITQLNGAIAKGRTRVQCPSGETTFSARAIVVGRPRFQAPGEVTACGVARIHIGRIDIQRLQWCRPVVLLPNGLQVED